MRLVAGLLAALGLATTAGSPAIAGSRIAADGAVMNGAFEPGFTVVIPDRDGQVGFRVLELGRLKVTSGRIVAADPFIAFEAPAFTVQVPPGDYPVRLAIAELGADHFRVALARIDFLATKPVRWELALTPGQSLKKLGPEEVFTFGVDTGTAAFGDADAFAWLAAQDEDLGERWIEAGEAAGPPQGLPHTFLLLPQAGPRNNMALFSSGWGDGAYACWFGYDAEGRVAALVADFAVVTAVTGLGGR